LSVATTKNTVTKWDILLPVGILTVVTKVFWTCGQGRARHSLH
jgi:hypothetical protein